MTNYDFSILQYNEFECLTRDLLQKEFGIYIESFKDGKDGGIDLRFGEIKGEKSIVQVKRYKEWNVLFKQLEKEVIKVEKLNPSRYILSTSVGLSPHNKYSIMEMFSPYIKDTSDIYGRDDLNNLIGKNEDIEHKYYKLWLASTNVLEIILKKRYKTWTDIQLQAIRNDISIYVHNQSFTNALKILQENHYVIISGIPGIGKTTLARMLVNKLLAENFDEFVTIEMDMSDASSQLKSGVKQVFFFDDFLGSNVLDLQNRALDKSVVDFIQAVRFSKDKLFILTTREYILNEALQKSDKLRTANIDVAKCIVDLGSYTPFIRAKILYNHVAGADLPHKYIESMLKDQRYLKMIKHDNFNPRIIEYYIDNGRWKEHDPDMYMDVFMDFFDNPNAVWENAFELRSREEQYALFVLATMGTPTSINDWMIAFRNFCEFSQDKLGLMFDDIDQKRIIKNLEGSFIATSITNKGVQIVDFFNHSIMDFLLSYIYNKENIISNLLRGTYYTDQLINIFSDSTFIGYRNRYNSIVNDRQYDIVVDKFREMFIKPYSCKLRFIYGGSYLSYTYSDIDFFLSMKVKYPIICRRYNIIEQCMNKELLENSKSSYNKKAQLIGLMDWDKTNFSLESAIDHMISDNLMVDEYDSFINMCTKLDKCDILEEEYFFDKLNMQIEQECNDLSSEVDAEYLKRNLQSIDLSLSRFDSTDFIEIIDRKKQEIAQGLEDEMDYEDYEDDGPIHSDEDARINEMFLSLRVKEE